MNKKYHINLKCFFQKIKAIYENQLLLAVEAKKKRIKRKRQQQQQQNCGLQRPFWKRSYSMSFAMLLADGNKFPAIVIN